MSDIDLKVFILPFINFSYFFDIFLIMTENPNVKSIFFPFEILEIFSL